jgi:hypothetical protein
VAILCNYGNLKKIARFEAVVAVTVNRTKVDISVPRSDQSKLKIFYLFKSYLVARIQLIKPSSGLTKT